MPNSIAVRQRAEYAPIRSRGQMEQESKNIPERHADGQSADKMYWFVMQHWDPQMINLQLQRENVRRRETDSEGLPQLEYFIPYCFLSRIRKKDNESQNAEIEAANHLRGDFHRFVFIHTTKKEIEQLVNSPWNQGTQYRLCHYKDCERHDVTITDEEKDNLIKIFSERKIRFSIGLPVADLGPDVIVQVCKEGSFKGKMARVIEVQHTADGISLKLGIPLFNGLQELKLQDLTLEDIKAKEETTSDIIGTLFVQNTEKTLVDILERRVKHNETDETRLHDATALNHTFLYSYVAVHDLNLSAHFLSLMLICASLRFDQDSIKALIARVKSCLKGDVKFPPDVLAIMNFSLYIATRDANYRTEGKQLVQQNPECIENSLRRLMSIVGVMRSRRKRKYKRK